MLKRFVRYSLAGITALVLVLWITGCIYPISISYAGTEKRQLNIHRGAMIYKYATIPDPRWVDPLEQGFSIEHPRLLKPLTIWEFFSLQLPAIGSERNSSGTYSPPRFYLIPFWIIFTPLVLLAIFAWYRSICDRCGTNLHRGFAIEVEQKSEHQDKDIVTE